MTFHFLHGTLLPPVDGQTMPFNTAKSLLAEAEALLAGSGLRPLDELIEVCGAGLGFLAREGATYSGIVPFCATITPHFESELRVLVQNLKKTDTQQSDPSLFYGEIQASCFALLENLALFMREKKLRNGGSPQSTAEERVLAYFETCGNWRPDSGEVVTDTYYRLLPIAVLHSLTTVKTKKQMQH